MSIVLYCNGYILVSPLKNNSYIYKKNNYISKEVLEKIIENIHNSKNKSDVKPILVSHKKMNDIKNKMIDLKEIPRIIISKTSVFSHLLHKKPIDINKLLKDIYRRFGFINYMLIFAAKI